MTIFVKQSGELTEETKENILEALRDGTKGVRITFTKKDGTERSMQCTLDSRVIPESKHPKTGIQKSKASDATCAVFDKELEEWRSFRWDSLTLVQSLY